MDFAWLESENGWTPSDDEDHTSERRVFDFENFLARSKVARDQEWRVAFDAWGATTKRGYKQFWEKSVGGKATVLIVRNREPDTGQAGT
jgi:hypothetical protein